MSVEELPPAQLRELQEWFASVITLRPEENSSLPKLRYQGGLIEDEVLLYLPVDERLTPYERMQIYSQCYWTRLITGLQETYPFLLRLFGYYDFNQTIAIGYFQEYPSTHWDIHHSGDNLPYWLEKSYHEEDRQLVLDAALIDAASQTCFFAKEHPAIDLQAMTPQSLEQITSSQLSLQPHILLFCLPYNLFQWRDEFLKQEPEYWQECDFPVLIKQAAPYYFIVFRSHQFKVEWKEISGAEFQLLTHIGQGHSIERACELLPANYHDLAQEKIAYWFQEWTLRGWLINIKN